jgi:hypothetical protein
MDTLSLRLELDAHIADSVELEQEYSRLFKDQS